ncbi:tetratricopeptide repeat protein [Caulobacter segnis]
MRNSISRRTFAISAAVAPLAVSGLARAQEASDWLHTSTPSFSLYGRVGEKTLVNMAEDLEAFASLLRSLHGVDAQAEERPLPIYLVPRQPDLKRVQPSLTANIAGFYNASVGDIFAVLALEGDTERGRQVLFHEYTHHFMKQHAPAAYASWLVEGYAEYFMTARFKPDVVELGVTSPRIAWLRGAVWTPFDQILGRRARTGDRMDMAAFYAQSWLLTHYMMSDPTRLARLTRYADAVAKGGDPVALMPEAAGVSFKDLERVLRQYMLALPGRRLPRPPSSAQPLSVTRLPASADDLLLENQRLKMGVPRAERPALLALIRERAARYPGDRLAEMTQARAENDYGDRDKAQALLKHRIEVDPRDVEALQTLGWSCMLQARTDPANAQQRLREAREWFGKGFAVDANNALLLYDYGISRRGDANYPNDNTVNVLLKAQALAPQVAQFRIAAADALVRRDRFDEAAAMVEPVFNDPHAGPQAAEAKRQFDEAVARRKPAATSEEGDK